MVNCWYNQNQRSRSFKYAYLLFNKHIPCICTHNNSIINQFSNFNGKFTVKWVFFDLFHAIWQRRIDFYVLNGSVQSQNRIWRAWEV